MKRSILLALALLASACATAATAPVQVAFTPPTTYTDGSPLGADLASYDVACTLAVTGGSTGPCVFTPTSIAGGQVSGNLTVTYPPQGGTACVTLVTVTTTGSRSVPSNQACKVIPPLAPNPPTGVTLTLSIAVTININGETVLAKSDTVTKRLRDLAVEK